MSWALSLAAAAAAALLALAALAAYGASLSPAAPVAPVVFRTPAGVVAPPVVGGYSKVQGFIRDTANRLRYGPATSPEAARAACDASSACVGYYVNVPNQSNPGDAGLQPNQARIIEGGDPWSPEWTKDVTGIPLDFYRKLYL